MKLDVAIDEFIADMRMQGRINSDSTERSYRGTLYKHCDDVSNRDPRLVGRDDVKRTLARWDHPNTRATCRAALVSFYRWMVEEGLRESNPALQTRPPKRRPVETVRLTREEVHQLVSAAETTRERRAIFLGIYLGLRKAELLGLQGCHFERPGWVAVASSTAKGQKPRQVPVPPAAQFLVDDIRRSVGPDEYVFPAQRTRDPGVNQQKVDLRTLPASPKAFWEMVKRVGERSGLSANVYPHLLRHIYADHAVRQTDIRNLQALLGHSDLRTTQIYVAAPSSDQLRAAVAGFDLGHPLPSRGLSPAPLSANPVEAPAGIEPA